MAQNTEAEATAQPIGRKRKAQGSTEGAGKKQKSDVAAASFLSKVLIITKKPGGKEDTSESERESDGDDGENEDQPLRVIKTRREAAVERKEKTPDQTIKTRNFVADTTVKKERRSKAGMNFFSVHFSDSDDDKVRLEDCVNCDNNRKKLSNLQDQLRQAEGKLVAMATATERIHSIIPQLLNQQKMAVRFFRKAVKPLPLRDSNEVNEDLKAFTAQHQIALNDILQVANEAQCKFGDLFPALASRVFSHQSNGSPTEAFTSWRNSTDPTTKLSDEDDVICGVTGEEIF